MKPVRATGAKDPIDAILGEGGLLAEVLAGYEARPAQIEMARRVASCFDEGTRLVVEAGTGTGKTLAYLLPAILSGKKVVVSTATKTLQGQVFEKDLPFLLGHLEKRYDLEVEVACMKGLSNFLCRRRFEEQRRSAQIALFSDETAARLVRWAGATQTGDRAELRDLPDDSPIWAEVCSSSETRIGQACRYYEECFVTAMRRRAAAARVVVVNHHLLLADLALRASFPEAGVIPPYEALVLDEAHQLEAIATSTFGRSVSRESLDRLARDAHRAFSFLEDGSGALCAERVQGASAELFYLLERDASTRWARDGDRGARSQPRADRGRIDSPAIEGERLSPYFTLDAVLEALADHLAGESRSAGARNPEEALRRESLAGIAVRADEARTTLAVFAERARSGIVHWWERPRSGLVLNASPVEVGPILARTLFADPIPAVLTSATLATGPATATATPTAMPTGDGSRGDLGFFRSRVGLGPEEADELPLVVEELVLPSPFCFEEQTLLYLPLDLPDPRDEGFLPRAADRAAQLIDIANGRTLFLFTSHKNLRAAREILGGRIAYPLLCQGDRSRSALLEEFRRDVASVLLATSSFWEGVDIRGESCSLVIIDKLPFASPDDPLTAARIELAQERDLDPFTTLQLPRCAISLKQGFGRLIRHRGDRGAVAILDRRVRTRAYGRELHESLPHCPWTSDLLRVRSFFHTINARPSGATIDARPSSATIVSPKRSC